MILHFMAICYILCLTVEDMQDIDCGTDLHCTLSKNMQCGSFSESDCRSRSLCDGNRSAVRQTAFTGYGYVRISGRDRYDDSVCKDIAY